MLFLAEFGPHADKSDVRQQNLQPHLDYLRENKASILLSATKRGDQEGDVLGFVWILKADSPEEAERLCHGDPFWTAGLRTTFQLSHLTKAIPELIAEV